MQNIIKFVDGFFEKNLRSPSLREIESETKIPRATAQRYLVEMNKQGMLEYIGENIITPFIKNSAKKVSSRLPLVGKIPCGLPQSMEQWKGEFIDFPASLLSGGEYFVLIADGDSMTDLGIDDGDYVVVKRSSDAEYGKVVVALDDFGRNTLKTLLYDKRKRRPFLHPENGKYSDIYPDELSIQGVAQKVIKNL